jgi:tetratricopeptide (TPR) repeat protein
MTNSDRILAQHNEAAEPNVDSSIDHQTSVGIGAVSGGLAGAVLGSMVAGRLGAAIGAVVGGVAGAAITNEKGEEISHAVENAVEAAKEKAQPAVMGALDQVESKASSISPDAANAVSNLKTKVSEATSSSGSSGASSSTHEDVDTQRFDQNLDPQPMSAPSLDSTGYTSGYTAETAYTPSDLSMGSTYAEDQTVMQAVIQEADVAAASTADDIYSAGNVDATSAYVEDTSLNSTVDSMTASPGYTGTAAEYTGSTGYVADDVYSPDSISTGSAYVEDQTSNYESTSSTGYATDAAYSPDAMNVTSLDEQYDQGVTLGKQGDLAGAIAAFQSVIAAEPNYAEAHYNLGVVLCKYGLTEQGITHMQQSRNICRSEGREKEAENIDRILQILDMQ